MFKKAMIKIMYERNKTTAEVDRDPVLKKEFEEAAITAISEEFLTCLFILMADNGWYKGLNMDLPNDFTMAQSNYPKTVVAAKSLLTDYIMPGKINYAKQDPDNVGVAFSETDCNNNWKKNVRCHGCGLKGHHIKKCNKTLPEDKKISTP